MKSCTRLCMFVLVTAGFVCVVRSQALAERTSGGNIVSKEAGRSGNERRILVRNAEEALLIDNDGECSWTSTPQVEPARTTRTSSDGWLEGGSVAVGAALLAFQDGSKPAVAASTAFRSITPFQNAFTAVPQGAGPDTSAPSIGGATRVPSVTATPEPGVWALLAGGGTTALCQLRRRRTRNAKR